MDTKIILQTINFIFLLIAIIILPLQLRKIKIKHHIYGAYSIYIWFIHTFIFHFAIMTNIYPKIFEYVKLKPIPIVDGWASVILWQIIVTLAVKEFLKIRFLNGSEE